MHKIQGVPGGYNHHSLEDNIMTGEEGKLGAILRHLLWVVILDRKETPLTR